MARVMTTNRQPGYSKHLAGSGRKIHGRIGPVTEHREGGRSLCPELLGGEQQPGARLETRGRRDNVVRGTTPNKPLPPTGGVAAYVMLTGALSSWVRGFSGWGSWSGMGGEGEAASRQEGCLNLPMSPDSSEGPRILTGPAGRAFVLSGGFLGGTLAGGWLGLVAAFVSGLAVSDPPRFPGEDLAAVLAAGVLATLYAFVYWANGRSTRNNLHFIAVFAALVVLFSVDSTGAIPLLASLPALLVVLLFALAAVRRSALLRLAGLVLGPFTRSRVC